MENEQQTPFEQLPMPRREVPQLVVCKYRIYTDAATFTIVEAATALQAMEVAGVKNAYKVLREDPMAANLIDNSALEMNGAATPEVASAAAVEPSPAPSA